MLKARPELEPVIGRDDARLRATNDVIGLLRNYIHGEALTQQLNDDSQPGITVRAGRTLRRSCGQGT